jgi:hypothetical protein
MAASVLSKSLFDPMMRTSRSATSTLWASAWMVATIAAAFDPHPLAGRHCELAQHRCGDRLPGRAVQHGLGAHGVGLGLIPDRL